MKTFKQFYEARKVDPVKLGQRASKIYGQKMDFPGQDYENYHVKKDEAGDLVPQKGKHIPLKKYDMHSSDEVHDHYMDILHKHSPNLPNGRKDIDTGRKHIEKLKTSQTFKISDLHPTQPFVSTSRKDILTKKVKSNETPSIATHKGKHYVLNGHHAILGAALRGEKHITSSHIDLDNLSKSTD